MRKYSNSYNRVLFGVVLVVSVFSIALTRKPHILEFIHYYLGAKYNSEVNYTGLYDAITTALSEVYGKNYINEKIKYVRNLKTDEYISVDDAISNYEKNRHRWTPKRWKQFVADVRFFDTALSIYSKKSNFKHWQKILVDHGYNATPLYTTYVAPVVNIIRLSIFNLYLMCFFDIIFIIAIFFLIRKIFGLTGAMMSMLFFASASDMLSYITWALFRFDWLFLIVLALFLIDKKSYLLSGILMGTSAALRIFPGIIGFIFFVILIIDKNIRGKHPLNFMYGLFIGLVGSVVISSFVMVKFYNHNLINLWEQFFEKITAHSTEIGIVNLIGLPKLFYIVGLQQNGTVEFLTSVAFAIILIFLSSKMKLNSVQYFSISILTLPVLLGISHYYYVMLIIPFAAQIKGMNLLYCALIITNVLISVARALNINYYSIVNLECIVYSFVLIFFTMAIFFKNYFGKSFG